MEKSTVEVLVLLLALAGSRQQDHTTYKLRTSQINTPPLIIIVLDENGWGIFGPEGSIAHGLEIDKALEKMMDAEEYYEFISIDDEYDDDDENDTCYGRFKNI